MSKVKAVKISFLHMINFIRKDLMLLAVLVSPFMIGLVIRLGIPKLEEILTKMIQMSSIIAPFYGLLDIFYAAITPVMFSFVTAMVVLEEHDDRIDRFLFVTGLGRGGYYVSRIIIPGIIAFMTTALLLPIFRLSEMTIWAQLFTAFSGTLQGIIIALLVVTLSTNKLEGMALTKMSSLLMLGAVVPYFIPKPYSFLLSFMPSFWTGMVNTEKSPAYMLPGLLVSLVWLMILWKMLRRKIG